MDHRWDEYLMYRESSLGNVEAIKERLAAGMNPFAHINWVLRVAAENGHTEVVKLLLAAEKDHSPSEVLPAASTEEDNGELMKVLLKTNTNFYIECNFALQKATRHDHVEVVKVLLEACTFHYNDSWKAIQCAAEYGHVEVVKILIATSIKSRTKCDYAMQLSVQKGHLAVVKELVAAGANINDALYYAVCNCRLEIAKVLLDAGADSHRRGNYELLKSSITLRQIEMVKLLLDAGADISTNNILYLAVHYDCLEIVKLLLAAGINVNDSNPSALAEAVSKRDLQFIKLLLATGADINIHDGYPLRTAVYSESLNIVEILLDAGADVFIKNHSALQIAINLGSEEIALALAFSYTTEALRTLQETLQSPLLAKIIEQHRPRGSSTKVALRATSC